MNRKYIALLLSVLWLPLQSLASQQVLNGYDGYWKDKKILTIFDLLDFSPDEFGYLRNEIFARYGRVFNTDKYRDHFNRQAWYTADPDYQDSWLTEQDRENVSLILSVERPGAAEQDMKRMILSHIEYTEPHGNTVLSFLGNTTVSVMDRSEGMGVYMGRTALEMKWHVFGDWIIVYDPKDPSQGVSAYLLDHDTRSITRTIRKTVPKKEIRRIIGAMESAR
jgi:hypothetical protein